MTETIDISHINELKAACARPKAWFDWQPWEGTYYAFGVQSGDEIWVEPRCPCCARFIKRDTVRIYANFDGRAEVFGSCCKCGQIQPWHLWM